MNPVDPFSFKRLSKLDPRRLWFTAKARLGEKQALRNFSSFQIPLQLPEGELPHVPCYEMADTAVTSPQMQILLVSIQQTEHLAASLVEIGAYRGVTTSLLAASTSRDYVAVDPYIGYGGAAGDFQIMQKRITGLTHVRHLRMTSGQAADGGHVSQASFVFVDAVHDYVNALFDGSVWGRKLLRGGLLAFHDTDCPGFAGVQRAVWELLQQPKPEYTLFAHVDGLIVLKKI